MNKLLEVFNTYSYGVIRLRREQDKQLIEKAKKESKRTGEEDLIITAPGSKEFFKFVNGQLEKYDLAKYRHEQIHLSQTEKEGAFQCQNMNRPKRSQTQPHSGSSF